MSRPILTAASFKDHPLYFLQMSSTQRLVMLENIHDVNALQQLTNTNIQVTASSQSII